MAEIDGVRTRSRLMGLGAEPRCRCTSILHLSLADAHPDPHSGHHRPEGPLHVRRRDGAHGARRMLDLRQLPLPPGRKRLDRTPRPSRPRHGNDGTLRKPIDTAQADPAAEPGFLSPGTRPKAELKFEQFNAPLIMRPGRSAATPPSSSGQAAEDPRVPGPPNGSTASRTRGAPFGHSSGRPRMAFRPIAGCWQNAARRSCSPRTRTSCSPTKRSSPT